MRLLDQMQAKTAGARAAEVAWNRARAREAVGSQVSDAVDSAATIRANLRLDGVPLGIETTSWFTSLIKGMTCVGLTWEATVR